MSHRKETNIVALTIFSFMFVLMYLGAGLLFSHGLHDPTYTEMTAFIDEDLTNFNGFNNDTYTCYQYSRDVILHARERGIKAGYVSINEPDDYGHAIVCFDTTDRGLCFIEPQTDQIFTQTEFDTMIQQKKYDAIGFNMTANNYNVNWWFVPK